MVTKLLKTNSRDLDGLGWMGYDMSEILGGPMNKKKNGLRFGVIGFILLLYILPSFSFSSTESFEVVATIPVETSLSRTIAADPIDTWVKMLDGATHTVELGHFYMATKENEGLESVIEAIIRAGNRGVKVRFLVSTSVNKSMEENTEKVIERLKNHRNLDILRFNWKELNGGVLHAKYMIVDKKEVYIGSQNFDWRSLKHIHETGLHIKSNAFGEGLSQVFELDWNYNKGDKEAYKKGSQFKKIEFSKGNLLVGSPDEFNPPSVKSAIKTLVQLIDDAKNKIRIQLLNYSTDMRNSEKKFKEIDDALRRAAARGVKIDMLVSDWNKEKRDLEGVQSLARVTNIKIRFVTIPESKEGYIPYARVIHSKVMRIDDDISLVGTSNWGYGYFYGSRNVEVITHDKKIANTLDRLFDDILKSGYAYEVDPDGEYTAPRHD